MAEGNKDNLEDLTVAQLRERASEYEITGRSSMNKDELVTAVADAQEQTATMEKNGNGGQSASADDEVSSKGDSGESGEGAAESGEIDASGITAPSIGPNTVIDLQSPEERLDQDKISKVDAMGLDKRRQVQGKRYGASPLKQAVVYGVAVLVIIGLFVGGKLLTDELDQAEPVANNAPWSKGELPLDEPTPIDFPRSTNR